MNARIVVIDDHPATLKLLASLLEYEGYMAIRATSARDGYQRIVSDPPDLVSVDVEMPEANGLWLVRLLKTQPETRHIPTIAVTAFVRHADTRRAHDAGCDGYLSKPVDVRRFADQVGAFLPAHLRRPAARPLAPA